MELKRKIMRQCAAFGMSAALSATMVSAPAIADEGLARTNRAYTQWYVDRAEEAAAAATTAAAALAAAQRRLAAAQANLAAVRAQAAATLIAVQQAAAAVAAAEAAVAAAAATYAALAKAAAVAAAAAAAWTAGTLIGQGANALWAWCWDPICDLHAVPGTAPGDIYRKPSRDEAREAAAAAVGIATGMKFDIASAIEQGGLSRTAANFVTDLAEFSIITLRGAAAHDAEQHEQVLLAVDDMKRVLISLKRNQAALAEGLETYIVDDGLELLEAQVAEAKTAIGTAVTVMQETTSNDDAVFAAIETMIAGLESTSKDLDAAVEIVRKAKLSGVPFGRLDDMLGAPIDVNSVRFFTRDCAVRGSACLPPAEIEIMEFLYKVAGVRSRSNTPVGDVIAQWDAVGLDAWETARLTAERAPTAAALAGSYMSSGTSKCGYWMDIQPDMSPLAIAARKNSKAMDVNGDGSFDAGDFTVSVDVVIGIENPLERSDVNRDGAVDFADLTLLKASQLGLPVRDNCPK